MNVLLVDDEPNVLKTLTIGLHSLGLEVVACRSPLEALAVLAQRTDFDLAFLDLKMHPIDGIALLQRLREFNPITTVSIITAHGTVDSAVQAIKHGAYDYLLKPIELETLRRFVDKAMAYHRLKLEWDRLRDRPIERTDHGIEIITRSAEMLRLIALAEKVANTPLPVLIEGESGTGKEMFAELIHHASARADKPFVPVNCAALPENLLESELFGHARGAFTGAHKDRVGRFELADGGTILLDEIGELPLQLQAKLLRILQNRQYERLGESQTREADVRIVAATNRDLDREIGEGRFREDLYYRLNVVRLRIPPLRERSEDLPPLVQHFIRKHSAGRINEPTISPEALAALYSYEWKGNVRELENAIARAVFLAQDNIITIPDLPDNFRHVPHRSPSDSLEDIEREHIARVISESRSLEEAARKLQIDTATLWRKRKKYNL